jgi:hypothetical protein
MMLEMVWLKQILMEIELLQLLMTIIMSLQQEVVIQQMTLKMEVVLMFLLLGTLLHVVGMNKYIQQLMAFQKQQSFINSVYFLVEVLHFQIF